MKETLDHEGPVRSLAAKRKAKKQLTMIPDGERAVTSRFHVILVGGGAREFAHVMVDSEIAQAYKVSEGQKPVKPMGALAEEEEAALSPQPSQISHRSSQRSPSPEGEGDDQERLVFYCPLDAESTDLARVLFTPCVKFSDALPLPKGDNSEKTVVVLLFWRVPETAENVGDTCTSSVISDFITRMAEIRYVQMQHRPYVSLLAFEAKEDQQQRLQDFLKAQSGMPRKVEVESSFLADGGEDFAMEELQKVCINATSWNPRVAAAALEAEEAAEEAKRAKKGARSCAIL